ncbi:MAG TPA: Asp-tRNA(Asn)/Glu-tRNA(Gln) amidotransferase subunit GatC [Thermomicrobiales bacterium]|nr:Asp-tRNA(Asn)/Glu-tRNA(Gln) amidotransferase subunit GatC [Thermomicrobiales bacterium]
MSLTRADVEHVASLARLGLSDDELSTFQEQLSSILGHIEALNELDTAAIAPTAQVVPLTNVVRADEVEPSFSQETVMELAPETRDGFIAVPAVMGGGEGESA